MPPMACEPEEDEDEEEPEADADEKHSETDQSETRFSEMSENSPRSAYPEPEGHSLAMPHQKQ